MINDILKRLDDHEYVPTSADVFEIKKMFQVATDLLPVVGKKFLPEQVPEDGQLIWEKQYLPYNGNSRTSYKNILEGVLATSYLVIYKDQKSKKDVCFFGRTLDYYTQRAIELLFKWDDGIIEVGRRQTEDQLKAIKAVYTLSPEAFEKAYLKISKKKKYVAKKPEKSVEEIFRSCQNNKFFISIFENDFVPKHIYDAAIASLPKYFGSDLASPLLTHPHMDKSTLEIVGKRLNIWDVALLKKVNEKLVVENIDLLRLNRFEVAQLSNKGRYSRPMERVYKFEKAVEKIKSNLGEALLGGNNDLRAFALWVDNNVAEVVDEKSV